MTITKQILLQIYPAAINTPLGIDNLVAALARPCPTLDGSKIRWAMFLAQTGEESMEYTHLSENLNYSAEALIKIFPSHFSGTIDASNYHRQPEKIANRIYANRMGNGSESTGDGWKFRGRGFIQCTGQDNYKACGTYIGVDLISDPDYLSRLPGAIDSAIWYWTKCNLNRYADLEDVRSVTHAINGGYLGLDKRISNYNLAKSLL